MWRLCTRKINTVHQTIWESDLWPAEWPFSFFFFRFFFFTKNEGKNWFADWLIELAFYRKNIRFLLVSFLIFFFPHLQLYWSARSSFVTFCFTMLGSQVDLYFWNRMPGYFASFCKCNRRLRACLHGGGRPQVGEVTGLGVVTRLSI